MNNSKVLLKVEYFRAISKAEIKLDGITVVAGVNGCGKSTLSKLLYWVYRGATDFSSFAIPLFLKDLEKSKILLRILFGQLINDTQDEKKRRAIFELTALQANSHNWIKNPQENDILGFFKKSKQSLIDSNIDLDVVKFYENNKLLIKDLFKNDEKVLKYIESIEIDIEQLFDTAFDFIISINTVILSEHNSIIAQRPKVVIDKKIQSEFKINYLPKKLEIIENNSPIVSKNLDYISTPYWIDNVIYIDTPMFFQNSGTEHWNDVNEKLKIRPELYQKKSTIAEIDDLIKKEVLTGNAEIKFDELIGSFIFKTSSGAEIDLSDSATGIKAFAVLDLLLKNKSINDKTLLILDEPEAHLHPQWIIEFGRLLTLIHKYIGAKVFVATHSPDMVQALRYIPNKEEIGEKVNFYLAKANESGQFDYQDLNGEIDEIFSSFNLSLDKLNKYGED